MAKRFNDTPTCFYDLDRLPDELVCQKLVAANGYAKPDGIVWCSDHQPPKIGDRVKINFNSLGEGTVESYFHEHDLVGVCVLLDKIPDWKMKQQDDPRREVALVFPKEIGL